MVSRKCYICFRKVDQNIKLCKCNKVFHIKCLFAWIQSSGNNNCEICNEEYSNFDTYIKKSRIIHNNFYSSMISLLIMIGVLDFLIIHYYVSKAHQYQKPYIVLISLFSPIIVWIGYNYFSDKYIKVKYSLINNDSLDEYDSDSSSNNSLNLDNKETKTEESTQLLDPVDMV